MSTMRVWGSEASSVRVIDESGVIPLPPPTSTSVRGALEDVGTNTPDGPWTSIRSPSCTFATRWRETRPSCTRLIVTATRAGSSALLDAEYARLCTSSPMCTCRVKNCPGANRIGTPPGSSNTRLTASAVSRTTAATRSFRRCSADRADDEGGGAPPSEACPRPVNEAMPRPRALNSPTSKTVLESELRRESRQKPRGAAERALKLQGREGGDLRRDEVARAKSRRHEDGARGQPRIHGARLRLAHPDARGRAPHDALEIGRHRNEGVELPRADAHEHHRRQAHPVHGVLAE